MFTHNILHMIKDRHVGQCGLQAHKVLIFQTFDQLSSCMLRMAMHRYDIVTCFQDKTTKTSTLG